MGIRYETEEVVYSEERRSGGTTTTDRRCTSGGRNSKLSVTYTNADSLISSMLEIKDYLRTNKLNVFCIAKVKSKEKNPQISRKRI